MFFTAVAPLVQPRFALLHHGIHLCLLLISQQLVDLGMSAGDLKDHTAGDFLNFISHYLGLARIKVVALGFKLFAQFPYPLAVTGRLFAGRCR